MEATLDASLAVEGVSSFGQEHFGLAQFGDKRLTARAVITANALLRHPGGTLPDKLEKTELLAFYDFANNPKVTHDNTLAAHYQHTRDLMERCPGTVLIVHDTTEADLTTRNIEGLGQIGNGGRRGILLHNVLAVDLANRQALGLVAQFTHKRREVPKGESPMAKRLHPQRESRLWSKGAAAVGRPPQGKLWVNLMDRGGDTFESMERQQKLGQIFVIRSRSDRNVEVADAGGRRRKRKLHKWARKLPRLGRREVAVSAQADREARTATVAVGCGPVRLLVPHFKRGEHGDEPLEVWVVHLQEVDAPKGVVPLEWILLSNRPTETREQAFERVDWYNCRPIVEEYHKAQKTGCGLELPQFTTLKAMQVTMALLSVVAVQLLRLRDLSRRPDADTIAATEVIDADYVEVLSLWRLKEAKLDWSVKEFLYALARLGGHLGRRGDRPPGWLVLWRGWMELQRLVDGARLIGRERCG
jgi:hypothetical protein